MRLLLFLLVLLLPTLASAQVCGDLVLDPGESCDDGALDADDGCDAACLIEPGWLCAEPLFFDGSWVVEDYIAAGSWVVAPDGDGVDSDAVDPTFFIAPFDANAAVQGFSVTVSAADDDFFGFAIGVEPGDSSNAAASYLLLDWKQGDQVHVTPAIEGMALSQVSGVPSWDEFWSHSDEVDGDGFVTELARAATLGNQGWEEDVTYEFLVQLADDSSLQVLVDGLLEFELPGPFADGSFALYNLSQVEVLFEQLSAEGSACSEVCGDGLLTPSDACDDANRSAGDGCATDCTVEEFWVCADEPSSCRGICGDGVVVGLECEDGNSDNGDGCSDACDAEHGFDCAPPFDLRVASPEGWGGSGDVWTVSADGLSATSSNDEDPVVLVAERDAMAAPLSFDVVVEAGDDDYIGWALGIEPGDESEPTADWLLIDWKQGDQNAYGEDAFEGLAISRVTGIPTQSEFWGHVGPVVELARATNLGSAGWVRDQSYAIDIEYSETQLQLWVDGVLELDLSGTFPAGSFGIYNLSQVGTTTSWTGDVGSLCLSECGDGSLAADEACDDGDLDPADGCDASCAVEAGWVCDEGDPSFCEPDSDGDGVGDSVDNCPDEPNGDQVDTDGDGPGDACDVCPFDDPDDTDGDGVCDSDDPCPADAADDTDGDGVCDSDDPCPLDAADDTDGDGVCDSDDPCPLDFPDDTDGDGVCDSDDLCPVDLADDTDGDGVCDSDDPCPLDAADDTDGDGVCDSDDLCPLDNPDDTDGDGVCDTDDPCPLDSPDDTDGDGVCDTDDPCPIDDPDDTDGDGV